ncbi:MAG: F0F1 ATP synthase subunit epsilon [Eubacteriales bacterium]|nr:F0F1 ATP synthase subunit epsilon [Eubacteriales bacterium]
MERTIPLKILTPDQLFFSGDVTMVVVPELSGEEGYLPEHMPILKMLVPGDAKIYTGKNEYRVLRIDGGHLTVADEIQIFTPKAVWEDDREAQNA